MHITSHTCIDSRSDDTNVVCRVLYDDGDREDLDLEELLPVLKVSADYVERVKTAHKDLMTVLQAAKARVRDEYLFRPKLLKMNKEWFGNTLQKRRQLSCSLMNFCVFRHPIGKCKCDNGVSPWLKSTADKPCVFQHEPSVCKCSQIAIKLSQDECSYAAYLLQKKEWRIGGQHGLRKKAPGPALMVSDYASFEFGLGVKVSETSLSEINRLRSSGPEHYSEPTQDGKRVKKKALCYYEESDSITVHAIILPGENKDGWWTLAKILHQAEDVVDVMRVVAPPRLFQYISFYDNSSVHNRREDLSLNVSKMGARWGGKKSGLRDSTIIEGCVGTNAAIMWYIPGKGTGEWRGGPKWVPEGTRGAIARVLTLKVGDTDFGRFHHDDPPPFYELDARRFDRLMTAREKVAERARCVKLWCGVHAYGCIYVCDAHSIQSLTPRGSLTQTCKESR